MHSLKKRLEVEGQIHKADNLKVMTDNMDLIQKINEVRLSNASLVKTKQREDNEYKNQCRKYGIKPVRTFGDQAESEDPLSDNSRRSNRNPGRTDDDETLINMRRETDASRNHLDMLKASIEEARQEQMQLEQILQQV